MRNEHRRLFAGGAFAPLLADLEAIHRRVLRSRVFVALHMHAGDGNVHTNIPVNSDDYQMVQEANRAVARIMRIARDLGGVISGEHGIGITKLEFLADAELQPFADYKTRVDPEGRFNKGKLVRGASAGAWAADLSAAYTPSFGLMDHESLIMQQSDIGAISESIKDCLAHPDQSVILDATLCRVLGAHVDDRLASLQVQHRALVSPGGMDAPAA